MTQLPEPISPEAGPPPTGVDVRARRRRWVCLGTALGVILVALVWWPWRATEQVYRTAPDGYDHVPLDDGSMLELNAATEVKVLYTSSERRVRLVRGEAYFIVAKSLTKPFVVTAASISVRAVGTAFNVRLRGNGVEVIVTEGRVTVVGARPTAPEDGEESEKTAPGGPKNGKPTLQAEVGWNERFVAVGVRPGAGSKVPATSFVERISAEAVREALAWQGERLVFLETPLADAVAQFNQRNTVRIELADAELGAVPVNGSFRAENVEAFVRLVSWEKDIVVDRPDPSRIVLRAPH